MSHRTEGSAALKADRHYTYRDYRNWPEDERWELIAGTAYAMSPAPRLNHQGLAGALYQFFARAVVPTGCKAYISPIDVFFAATDEEIDAVDTVVQPDIVVVCDVAKLVPEGVKGAPDLIVEIISPRTAMRDQTEKRALYESHGVREYWIANPTTLEVLVYTLADGRYGLPVPGSLPDGVASRIFAGLVARVTADDL